MLQANFILVVSPLRQDVMRTPTYHVYKTSWFTTLLHSLPLAFLLFVSVLLIKCCHVTFVCLPLGGEGGCPRCAACFPLYGWRWHSAVHQWCVRPAVTMGTLLPLGFLWRQTVPEQTGPGRPRPGSPARHVWRAGTNTVLLSRSKSYNIGYLPVQVIESDPVCFGHIKTTAIAS